MRDTQGERQQPDDELVDELEQLAMMLLERGSIAASSRRRDRRRDSDARPADGERTPGLKLANGDDEVELVNASGAEVDRVAYTASWAGAAARSSELADASADNAVAGAWALAAVRGGSFTGTGADRGAPGAAAGPQL